MGSSRIVPRRLRRSLGKAVRVVDRPERTESAQREGLIVAMRRHDERVPQRVRPGHRGRVAIHGTKREHGGVRWTYPGRAQHVGQQRAAQAVRLAVVLERRLDGSGWQRREARPFHDVRSRELDAVLRHEHVECRIEWCAIRFRDCTRDREDHGARRRQRRVLPAPPPAMQQRQPGMLRIRVCAWRWSLADVGQLDRISSQRATAAMRIASRSGSVNHRTSELGPARGAARVTICGGSTACAWRVSKGSGLYSNWQRGCVPAPLIFFPRLSLQSVASVSLDRIRGRIVNEELEKSNA